MVQSKPRKFFITNDIDDQDAPNMNAITNIILCYYVSICI